MKDGKMTMSEAGRMGWEKSREKREERKRIFRDKYEAIGKKCLACGEPISYEKRYLKFCNHSCSACFNNKGVRRHGNPPGNCMGCGVVLGRGQKKFCSNACQHEYAYREFVEGWMAGKDVMVSHGLSVSQHIKRWLRENNGCRCQVCKGEEWMGKPMPLTVDHVDGDYRNNRPENLRMVCGNCGMQLPIFTGRNRGHGRMARKSGMIG